MKKTENVKGRGFKRKTSLGLVCGIALTGAFLLGANGVSADEATAPTTATPNTTATANESKTVTVDEGLTETANKAKEAGLTVNAEPTKNIGTANTEAEAKKLDEQAKKEVADQKAEIEKKTNDFKAQVQSQAGGVKRQEVVDKLNQEGQIYNNTADGLRALADDAYNKGQSTYGGFTSSNGTVRYLDAPSEFYANDRESTIGVLNSAIGTSPKEVTMKYTDSNIIASSKANYITDRSSLKVVPILVSDGETITYKVNVSSDSELGKLGVKTVERSLTLKGSPVGAKGKFAFLTDLTGSIHHDYAIGGLGLSNEVMNSGKEFDLISSWNYLDASGKAIDSKELTARFVNAKWYPNLNIKASEIKTAPTTDTKSYELTYGNENIEKLSDTFVNGGSKFSEKTRKNKMGVYTSEHENPFWSLMSLSSYLVKPVNNHYATTPTAPTVNYHLVSYTVNKPKATNNPDTVKKGSIVQVFIEEGGKEIAPKTNTGEKPVDETVKLTHPNEITFEGKTYTFTKQDKVDPTKIPNGTETITYVYKLKETPKPTPTPVEKPTTIHIDGNTGKEIAPKEDGTKPFKTIDGYEPSPKDPKNVENPKGETVRVYNIIKKGNVEVRYVKDDASRTVLKEPVADTVGGKVGSDYDTTDHKPVTITKDGVTYELVRSEGVEKGKVVEGKTVVTYVYRQTVEPTTIHIDEEGNRVAPPEKGTKPFKNIDGFEPSPKNPKNVENPKGETVRVYKVVKGDVEVRYIKDDKERTTLKEPVADTTQAKVGTKYDTTDHKPVTITKDGVTYELVRTEGTEKGDVVKGKTVVTYVYRQTVEPTTIHIDEEGNRVAPPEKGTKPFKNIDGFEPSPKNPKNVENPKGETVRVYKVVKGDVEVRYIKDDKERTTLKEPVADTTQAKVGTKYDTTDHKPVTITKDGVTYELVRTEGTEKGDVVKGKTVVTYVYREVQKPITIHIDTEGNPVAPQEDGTKPFKEIEGYKPAPKDSKNVEDPKGVTVRVYDKVKPEAPQEAPKTPEKPEAPKPTAQANVTATLPNTGSEASTALALAGMSILGLSGLVYKKKED